jgi:hypothetical protein
MTMMPCTMMLVGWALDETLTVLRHGRAPETPVPDDAAKRFAGATATTFWITVAVCAAAAVAAPLAARNLRGSSRPYDFAVAAGLLLAMAAAAWTGRRRGLERAVWTFAAAWAVALTVCNGWWWPTAEPNDPRAVAAEFRRVAGDGPYCSYGTVAYLPLCFALRAEVPAAFTPDELRDQLAAQPGLHVIIKRRPRDERPLPNLGFVREAQVLNDDDLFELYRPASK